MDQSIPHNESLGRMRVLNSFVTGRVFEKQFVARLAHHVDVLTPPYLCAPKMDWRLKPEKAAVAKPLNLFGHLLRLQTLDDQRLGHIYSGRAIMAEALLYGLDVAFKSSILCTKSDEYVPFKEFSQYGAEGMMFGPEGLGINLSLNGNSLVLEGAHSSAAWAGFNETSFNPELSKTPELYRKFSASEYAMPACRTSHPTLGMINYWLEIMPREQQVRVTSFRCQNQLIDEPNALPSVEFVN